MHASLADVVGTLTLLLLIAFLVHSYVTFRKTKVHRVFYSWLSLWFSFVLLYACVVFKLRDEVGISAAHLVALSLLFCAISLRTPREGGAAAKKTFHRSVVTWCLVTLASLTITMLFLLNSAWQYAPANILCFLGLTLYAARHASAFPKAKDTVLLLLYVYAGVQMFTPGPLSPFFLLPAVLLLLPLKLVLYYSGYVTLYYLASRRGAANLPEIPERLRLKERPKPHHVATSPLPEPGKIVHLTGLWGFLYLVWRYPSGKAIGLLLLGVIVSGAALSTKSENLTYITNFAQHLWGGLAKALN